MEGSLDGTGKNLQDGKAMWQHQAKYVSAVKNHDVFIGFKTILLRQMM